MTVSIKWRSVPKIMQAEWKGYANSKEFRAALLTGLRAIREHHAQAYVTDTRKAKVFSAEDELWAREVWLPQAVTAGLKRAAIVTAEVGIAKVIFEKFAKDTDTTALEIRKFASVDAATTWALTGLAERSISS